MDELVDASFFCIVVAAGLVLNKTGRLTSIRKLLVRVGILESAGRAFDNDARIALFDGLLVDSSTDIAEAIERFPSAEWPSSPRCWPLVL